MQRSCAIPAPRNPGPGRAREVRVRFDDVSSKLQESYNTLPRDIFGSTGMPANILLVEDEPAIKELIAANRPRRPPCGARQRRRARISRARGAADLVLLDWMLPAPRASVCPPVARRRAPHIPIIMLTARGENRFQRSPRFRDRRRRLHHQALQPAQAGRAHQGGAAPACPQTTGTWSRARRPAPGPRHPPMSARADRARAQTLRVPPAAFPLTHPERDAFACCNCSTGSGATTSSSEGRALWMYISAAALRARPSARRAGQTVRGGGYRFSVTPPRKPLRPPDP